jgi:rubrerythrin
MELETIRRRKGLAQGVNDAETVQIAERFETQHAERLAVLQQKLAAQEGELSLVERDVTEMREQLKAAMAGVGSGMRSGTVDAATDPLDDGKANLEQQLNDLKRAERRANADATADAALAELKKRMGR